MVLAYSVTNINDVDQYYFVVYFFNNSTWSSPVRIAHIPGSPEGLQYNDTITSYDDTLAESALAIASANTRFVFAWAYNQTILYRTWSPSAGGSKIYFVPTIFIFYKKGLDKIYITPPVQPISFMKLVQSGSTVVMLIYGSSSSKTQPSSYTFYEMLPSSDQFGLPATLLVPSPSFFI